MSKVVFEFDLIDNAEEIALIVNRHKMMSALYDVQDFARVVYNDKIYNDKDLVYIKKDGSIATKEDYDKMYKTGEQLEGGEYYLRKDYVEAQLDYIMNKVKHLLD